MTHRSCQMMLEGCTGAASKSKERYGRHKLRAIPRAKAKEEEGVGEAPRGKEHVIPFEKTKQYVSGHGAHSRDGGKTTRQTYVT